MIPLHEQQNEMVLEAFVSQTRQIRDWLAQMKQLTRTTENLHSQTLIAANIEEARKLTAMIDAQVAEHQATTYRLRDALKQLREQAVTAIQNAMLQKLYKELGEQMSAFREMQTKCQEQYKRQLKRQYLTVCPAATRAELDSLTASENQLVLSEQVNSIYNQLQMFCSADMAQAQETLLRMQERQQEVSKIEKTIIGQHQLILEMNTLLEQQGYIVIGIAEHVHATEANTRQAGRHIQEAVPLVRHISEVSFCSCCLEKKMDHSAFLPDHCRRNCWSHFHFNKSMKTCLLISKKNSFNFSPVPIRCALTLDQNV